jgi:F-type H+-transporting ATPase subunit delta
MISAQLILASQYAHAFLNVFGTQLQVDDYEQLHQAAHFLKNNDAARRFLKIPLIDMQEKKVVLEQLMHAFRLPDVIQRLIDLLLKHKRIYLLAEVFEHMYRNYLHKNSIEFFTIKSSHALSDDEIQDIEKFLNKETGKKIRSTVVVDSSLIAGLQLTSATKVWEYSVRKQLNTLQLLRKELYGY